jgi:phosphatidate cytidylyltransferase
VYWGWMLFVYGLSHAYFVVAESETIEPAVGRVGWFLYLVILTETNDIAQAIIGRRFGRTKITPRISPNKSLEGLLGGILVTTSLAILLAPWLTTLMHHRGALATSVLQAMLSGGCISLLGFFGDINMSGIKRDAGVKDGSRLLPGQGGIIDRVDSLTFTAPAFYYFVQAIV